MRSGIGSCGAVLLAAATAASAWDGSAIETSGASDRARILAVAPAADGSRWLQAQVGAAVVLARTDGDRARVAAWPGDRDGIVAALPDGGVATGASGDFVEPFCRIRRWDAAGSLRWTQILDEPNCLEIAADGGGNLWVRNGDRGSFVVALGVDGAFRSTVASIEPIDLSGDRFAADPLAAGAYRVGRRRGDDNAPTAGIVARQSATGETLWRYELSAPRSVRFDAVATDIAGRVVAAGRIATAVDDEHDGVVVGLDRTGRERWRATIAGARLLEIHDVVVDGDSGAYVATEEPVDQVVRLVVRRVGADGNVAWRFVAARPASGSSPGLVPTRIPALLATGGDGVWVHEARSVGEAPPTFALRRLGRDGAEAATLALPPGQRVRTIASRGDGSLEMVVEDAALPTTDPARYRALRVSPSAQAADLLPPIVAETAPGGIVAQQLRAGEPAFVLTQDVILGRHRLSRFEADGTRRWQATGDGAWQPGGVTLDATATRTCVSGQQFALPSGTYRAIVECRAVADGALLWRREILSDAEAFVAVTHRTLADGGVVVLAAGSRAAVRVRLDAAGNELARAAPAVPLAVVAGRFGADGSLALLSSEPGGRPGRRLSMLDAQGVARFVLDPDALGLPGLGARNLQPAPDGRLLVGATSGTATGSDAVLTQFEADGRVAWTQRIPDATADDLAVLRAGNALYASLAGPTSTFGGVNARVVPADLVALDAASGALRWRRDLASALFRFPRLSLAPDGASLLVSTSRRGRIHLSTFAASDGRVVRERVEPCGSTDCTAFAVAVDADGSARVLASTTDLALGPRPRIYRLRNATTQIAPAAVTQAGIEGAWFSPATSGQGVTLGFDPGSGTLFGAWFTHAPIDRELPYGRNAPEALRWFTLQGNPPAGATTAELGLFSVSGGRFASPPALGVERIGSARFVLEDCGRASLHYAFEGGEAAGRADLIGLVRASPGTAPCNAPGGSVPQPAVAARDGFDLRQSGAWFDPATAGQGLYFVVLPRSDAQAGLLFGAWFTFDPAGAADDPTAQHWFTLQGDLASARDGTVVVPLLRTIGGSLDRESTTNTQRVGEATLRFEGCERASLEYRFDASDVALPFGGRRGVVALQRATPCTPR